PHEGAARCRSRGARLVREPEGLANPTCRAAVPVSLFPSSTDGKIALPPRECQVRLVSLVLPFAFALCFLPFRIVPFQPLLPSPPSCPSPRYTEFTSPKREGNPGTI